MLSFQIINVKNPQRTIQNDKLHFQFDGLAVNYLLYFSVFPKILPFISMLYYTLMSGTSLVVKSIQELSNPMKKLNTLKTILARLHHTQTFSQGLWLREKINILRSSFSSPYDQPLIQWLYTSHYISGLYIALVKWEVFANIA